MEHKKSPKANLENKRNLFLQIGIVLALAVVLLSFEYKSPAERTVSLGEVEHLAIEQEIIPITRVQEVKPPPPPPPKVVEVLNIVNNDTNIDEQLDITEDDNFDEPIVIAPVIAPVEEPMDDSTPFVFAEVMPEFPGGTAAMMAFLAKNVKYPVTAAQNGITGRVIVSFVVNVDGSIADVKILRGVDPSLDKAAVAVVQSMPRWSPGKQGGQAVRVSYNVPISFQLAPY